VKVKQIEIKRIKIKFDIKIKLYAEGKNWKINSIKKMIQNKTNSNKKIRD
jgi:hypothetical protein